MGVACAVDVARGVVGRVEVIELGRPVLTRGVAVTLRVGGSVVKTIDSVCSAVVSTTVAGRRDVSKGVAVATISSAVGAKNGLGVGDTDGASVDASTSVGNGVGIRVVGSSVGPVEGATVGAEVMGAAVGRPVVGSADGLPVVGASVGVAVVGASVGALVVGDGVGASVVGIGVGDRVDGVAVGAFVVGDWVVGSCVGLSDAGAGVGVTLGASVVGDTANSVGGRVANTRGVAVVDVKGGSTEMCSVGSDSRLTKHRQSTSSFTSATGGTLPSNSHVPGWNPP
mmetsp:Transcript_28637/g.85882  ORF Transcript_28637/g.85882 Transcript_28637/m.85882 type:complete len:283 (-) Transcript_28637:1260-2108(-)